MVTVYEILHFLKRKTAKADSEPGVNMKKSGALPSNIWKEPETYFILCWFVISRAIGYVKNV